MAIESLHFRAVNADNGEMNNIKNQHSGEYGPVAQVARDYKAKGTVRDALM